MKSVIINDDVIEKIYFTIKIIPRKSFDWLYSIEKMDNNNTIVLKNIVGAKKDVLVKITNKFR